MALETIVLMLPDRGLRANLIGRLAARGQSLVTLDCSLSDSMLEWIAAPPVALIFDLDASGVLLGAVCEDQRWDRIVAISNDATQTACHPHVFVVPRDDAVSAIEAALADNRHLTATRLPSSGCDHARCKCNAQSFGQAAHAKLGHQVSPVDFYSPGANI